MKKNEIIEQLCEIGAKIGNDGTITMSKSKFDEFEWVCDESLTITKNGNIATIKNKNGKISIDVIVGKSTKPNNTKPTTNGNNKNGENGKNVSRETKPHNSKSKNDGYIILLKNNGEKSKKITNISNCAEIKTFIKSLNRKNVEYLKIYDNNNVECRKSAWIER